ncbi:hypothetical protein OIU78_016487 [Salix suchowensis]|nr:hypothetical protein OIU78_016487 [Salix suchowensis]
MVYSAQGQIVLQDCRTRWGDNRLSRDERCTLSFYQEQWTDMLGIILNEFDSGSFAWPFGADAIARSYEKDSILLRLVVNVIVCIARDRRRKRIRSGACCDFC